VADFDNAFLYYSRCLNIAKEIGERNAEASMLNDIANIFQITGEYDKALKYYEEFLKLQNNDRLKNFQMLEYKIIKKKREKHDG